MKGSGMMKRLLCVALIVMLLTLSAAPALAKAKGAYVVTTSDYKNRLRVRSTPGGSVKKYLRLGSVVQYKSSKSGWWKVQYRKNSSTLATGYVDRHYLTSVASLSSAKYKSVDNLYVRYKPKRNSAKYSQKLTPNKKVTIVKQSGTWVCVNYKGNTGWVPAVYLKCVS